MKLNKYLSLAVVSMLGAGYFTSCDNSKDNDYVSEYDGAPGIYFSTTENAYLELEEGKSTIIYNAYRDVAGEETTVALTVNALDAYEVTDIYTFPSSVTFPAGSKVGEIAIGYDISKAELGAEQQYQLVLDAEPNPFSSNSVIITLVNPAPWTYLGTGQYYDYGWGVSDTSAGPVNVAIYQQGVNKNIYRISNPYVGYNNETDSYLQIRILQKGEVYLGEQIDIPDLVAWDMYYITYDQEDQSDIYLAFPGLFGGLESPDNWTNCHVVEYQENGLPGFIELGALYYAASAGAAYGDLSPYVEIYFPGYVSYDTTLSISYEGTLTTQGQDEYVLINAQIGEDISEARAAVSKDLTANDLVTAIEAGTVDYTTFNQSGSVKIPFDNMETGQYNLAVVGYVDGEAKNYKTLSFFYVASDSDYNPNEGWNSLGYVVYSDGYVVASVFTGTDQISYWVEIQENESTPGLYRLVNPYGTQFAGFFESGITSSDTPPCYLIVDATDKQHVKVLQTEQPLTFSFGQLSYTWCWADMWEQMGATQEEIEAEEDVYGTLVDGEITFPATALCAIWSDEPDQWYSANYSLDYDAYLNGSRNPYYFNEDGSMFAPFCIDFNTLTQEDEFATRSSVLSRKVIMPRSANMLKTRTLPQKAKENPRERKLKQAKLERVRKVK